jgi:catechol 2,3-dioxygenase-like lactoylglutathione lyase family enzyme
VAISIQSVMHVNVNCSDLARSLRFYRDVAGLVPASHTNPVPQDGAGFGMQGRVQWDAHILQDARGFAGPGVDLLEWKEPPPVGKPYQEANHVGFHRIAIAVPDLDAAYARAREEGAFCYASPMEYPIDPEAGVHVRMFTCLDPDGVAVEFFERPDVEASQLFHVNINCTDLEQTIEWYERVMGMQVRGRSQPGAVSGQGLGLAGEVEWDARLLWPEGQSAFAIDLLEWKQPKPVGTAYSEANHLGIYRMAFMVEDIKSSHAELIAQGVECDPPVFLDMGPEIPIDGVWAVFFPDPDGICLELIETPQLATP